MGVDFTTPGLEDAVLALSAALTAQEPVLVLVPLVGDLAALLAPQDALASIHLSLSATIMLRLAELSGRDEPRPAIDRTVDRYRETFRSRKG